MPRQSGMADRDPCPWRIVDDVGGAFCMGAIGGGIWHTIKGARMAPKGARIAGSVSAVSARAPVLGGQFAVWGGLFACCDCTLTAIRQKEDPWNSIISGATTGGILAARAGPRAMASGFMVGGVLLALIEGMGIMISHWGAAPPPTAADYEKAMQQQQPDVTAPPTTGGLFPGMFGTSQPSGNVPPAMTAPPEPQFLETDGVTTFSTESTSGSSSQEGGGSSFWSVFGSSSKES